MRSKEDIQWSKSEVLRKKKARLKRNDNRPVCNCNAYKFPHKIGGKCKGQVFAEFYFYKDRDLCDQCNCFNDHCEPISCDVVTGTESIKEAECFIERVHSYPSERLPLEFNFDFGEEQENETT